MWGVFVREIVERINLPNITTICLKLVGIQWKQALYKESAHPAYTALREPSFLRALTFCTEQDANYSMTVGSELFFFIVSKR